MTDLRKLLGEARELIAHRPNCEYGYDCNAQGCTCEYEELRSRIDAALAEKVEPVPVEPFRRFRGVLKPVDRGMWVNGPCDYYHDAEVDTRIDSLQSALKLAQEERDRLKSYWLAIDNRMVVLHLGTADSFDADTCMNKILEWETTIALDPQVSRPAQELKDTHLQRAEKAEAINRRMVELLKPLMKIADTNSAGWSEDEVNAMAKGIKAMSAELLKEVEK